MIPGFSGWIEEAKVVRHAFVNALYPPGPTAASRNSRSGRRGSGASPSPAARFADQHGGGDVEARQQ
jgi:hypothetical protein